MRFVLGRTIRRPAFLGFAILVIAACEDAAGPKSTVSLGQEPEAGLGTLAVPCTAGCVLPATVFARRDGQTVPDLREFPGDPGARYVLIVQDDGREGTAAEIKLNGKTVVKRTALQGAAISELAVGVQLKASNRLTVLPLGTIGASVTVWIVGRALVDPVTVLASAAGLMKTWVNTRNAGTPSLTLTAMADHTTMSWNNWNARYYSSYGVDCPNRCGWVNSTATHLGDQVQAYWYGMYSVLASANDILFAIRKSASPPDLGSDKERVEAIAQMAQAMAHGWISLNYDQGFILLEDTDPLTLTLSTRAQMRDKAMELFDKAYTHADGATFNTGATWFGTVNSPIYSSKQLTKVIRTMQAELLASYPRNSEENAQVNWGTVAALAAAGISSATNAPPSDFEMYADGNRDFFSQYHAWTNDYATTRVDTRVARLIATNQIDPWPGGVGNPQPNPGIYGVDRRLGDGCFGDTDDWVGMGGCAATANSGTDFAWSPVAIFIPGRGSFHQSNIGLTRDHCLAGIFPDCPTGTGPLPVLSKAYNDLLWAEGLIRSNGSRATAVALINESRVGRGGLPPVSGADSDQDLLRAAAYEYEIELFHVAGGADFFFRRRLTSSAQVALPEAYNRLWPDTPRHMPIPAKDLLLLRQELYSFGGPTNPGGLAPGFESGARVKGVREIWAEMERKERASMRSRRRS